MAVEMQQRQSIVLILPDHADNTLIADFRVALKTLKIPFRSHSLSTWSGRDISEPTPLIFWLTGEKELQSMLAALPPGGETEPAIGVLPDKALNWQKPELHRFDDVIRWPCETGELGFRLARLGLPKGKQEDAVTSNLIGISRPFYEIKSFVHAAADVHAPVLITGETGTGKEVIARSIHYLGPQKSYPFVPFNCGGVPVELLENELFGHEAGAFTSAQRKQSGLVAQAEGGTLFLDEIDALPLRSQAGLLRFLQDYEYRPLGGQQLNRAHLRIVAASNTDLQERVSQGKFREDLWYRLNVLAVHIPPLRERREDIPLLANHFMRHLCATYGKPERELSSHTVKRLLAYSWPGNVRELENWVHRFLLLGEEKSPLAEEYPFPTQSLQEQGLKQRKNEMVAAFERDYLISLMTQTHGNVTQAANIAGTERRCLGKLLKKHGVQAADFRQS